MVFDLKTGSVLIEKAVNAAGKIRAKAE